MDQWLVRTANNAISGPYNREQVIELILGGTLGLQDEICEANHYWIFLHEHQEVFDQLGIRVPRAARHEEDEITETQVEVGYPSSPSKTGPAAVAAVGTTVLPRAPIERPLLWRILAWGMILSASFLVVAVLRLLRG